MLERALQGQADGAGQVPVCAQETAPQANDSSSDPRARQTGEPAGFQPGCLHNWSGASHTAKLLQVNF